MDIKLRILYNKFNKGVIGVKKIKKYICLTLLVSALLMTLVACGQEAKEETGSDKKEEVVEDTKTEAKELPEISISWGAALHTAILEAPLNEIEDFKEMGVYLNPLSDNKYELIDDGEAKLILSFMPNKGASEVATLMGQGHLDSAIVSNTGMLTAYDAGTDLKILTPSHTKGIALVFPEDKNIEGWQAVEDYIKGSEVPVKIGYHSPVSAPRMIIESVLKDQGYKVTEDPSDIDADVLLVDLKGNKNLLPSLGAGQVDGWVGPSVFPETAESQGLGKIAATLEEFPPLGKWTNFPCCVFAARDEAINEYRDEFKSLVKLIDLSCDYCNDYPEKGNPAMAKLMGVDKEIVDSVDINFTTNASEEWLDGIGIYVDLLNRTNKFEGRLKGKTKEEVIDEVFDFSLIDEVKK